MTGRGVCQVEGCARPGRGVWQSGTQLYSQGWFTCMDYSCTVRHTAVQSGIQLVGHPTHMTQPEPCTPTHTTQPGPCTPTHMTQPAPCTPTHTTQPEPCTPPHTTQTRALHSYKAYSCTVRHTAVQSGTQLVRHVAVQSGIQLYSQALQAVLHTWRNLHSPNIWLNLSPALLHI